MDTEKDYLTLSVNMDEAKLIFKALGKLPFDEVYELIGSLNNQINDQAMSNSSEENRGDDK